MRCPDHSCPSVRCLLVLVSACTGELGGGYVQTDVSLLIASSESTRAEIGAAAWEIRSGEPGIQVAAVGEGGERIGSILYSVRDDAMSDDPVLTVKAQFGAPASFVLAWDGILDDSLFVEDATAPWLRAVGRDMSGLEEGTVGYRGAAPCSGDAQRAAASCAWAMWDCHLGAVLPDAAEIDARRCIRRARACARAAIAERGCAARGRLEGSIQ